MYDEGTVIVILHYVR